MAVSQDRIFTGLIVSFTDLAYPMEGLPLFAAVGLLATIRIKKGQEKNKRNINKLQRNPARVNVDTEIAIIGAGPAGSTAAYFAVKKGIKVIVFDKKVFPRPKPCGDAWCKPALDILEEMGILGKMEQDGIARAVKRGGLISPFGYQCINTDGDSYGSVTGCKTYAIKREIADEYLVRAASSAGADVREGVEVTNCVFTAGVNSNEDGYWTLSTKTESGETGITTARLLLICDGSTSYMAQKLGIIPQGSQPEAVCSTAYAMNNAWKDADGVMIFTKNTLPGYSALFRHYNDDMYLGTYILPGGQATSRYIAPFETEAMQLHPYINEALGDKFQWRKKRQVAPIRLGGVERAYGPQALLVGDSAGHVDPLTGEGIHTAMIAGKIAAQVAKEMFDANNLTEEACLAYQLRCWDSFVHEFRYSSIAARVVYYMPIAIDAVTCVGQRRGQAFLDFFGEVMTGVKPKSDFLQPGLLLDITVEIVRQFFIQYILRREPLIPYDIGRSVLEHQAGTTKTGGFA